MPATIDLRVGPSGQGIVVHATDGTADSDITAISSHPTIRINGGSPIALGSPAPFWFRDPASPTARLPYAYYCLPAGTPDILSSDVVTYSAASGFLACVAGTAPGATNAAVANLVGGTIYPTVPDAPKSMQIGYNVEPVQVSASIAIYANHARQLEGPLGLASDGDGYPTILSSDHITVSVALSPMTADGTLAVACPEGDYTLMWDGACDVRMPSPAVEDVSRRSITGTADNKRVYAYGYGLDVEIHGTTPFGDGTGRYHCDLQKLRVYAPGVDPASPVKWHPRVTQKVQNSRTSRFLDCLLTNFGNSTDYSDFNPPDSLLRRSGALRSITATVAEVRGYSGSDHWWDPTKGVVFQVTTTAPHGLSDGQQFSIYGVAGSATLSDGSTGVQLNNTGLVRKISDTVFTYVAFPGNRTMTNVVSGSGSVMVLAGSAMPVRDMVDFCNFHGSDLWLNVPFTATPAATAALADFVAANLLPGLKCRVEFSNEVWNFSFPARTWCGHGTYSLGLGDGGYPVPYLCIRSKAVHDIFLSRFALAARESDVVRLIASFQVDTQVTADIANFCAAEGITFEELPIGGYWSNQPCYADGGSNYYPNDAVADAMTTGQVLDVGECNTLYSNRARDVAAHRARLDAAGLTGVKISVYEGGPEYVLPGGSNDRMARSHRVHRHPRFFGLMRYLFQCYENAGVTAFNIFNLGIGDPSDGQQWSAYVSTLSPPGTGDPILDSANITDPFVQNTIKSEIGGAMRWWADRTDGATPAPDPTPSTSVRRLLRRLVG